ncbi:MAG: TonB-dependent receptor [Deltaproteobacteria bacterium]|nr:TonB-dependent receptor [Deltaproteobacteria bacterium]
MLFAAMLGLQAGVLFAGDDPDEAPPAFVMDEVVVTADRQSEQIRRIPANVTVITASDIERSSARTIVELLSAEGGLTARSLLGNDKKAVVDIRGMGETSVSNVLVLVDGVGQNPADMAGPDFSSLFLDQVERIEILRGAGAVLYGDGAVGGVINIITRPAGGKPHASATLEGGSDQYTKGAASVGGAFGPFRLSVIGNYSDTDGYRQKGYFWNKNVSTDIACDLGEHLSLWAKTRLHKDHYGLPGPLTLEQFDQDPRQSTDTTDSNGETWQESYSAGLEAFLADLGNFSASVTYKERENAWVQTLTPGSIESRTREMNLRYQWNHDIGACQNELTLGWDRRDIAYDQETSFATKPYDVQHAGTYVFDKLTLRDHWVFQAGARHHDYENILTTTGKKTTWTQDVYTLGAVRLFEIGDRLKGSLFANHATSFRVPNVDELGFATDDIRPQTGDHWDAGAKLLLSQRAELGLTWFHIRIQDEIWFDAFNYINTNYDRATTRKGLEAALRFYPTDTLKLWANHTYTKARFEDVDYEVPTVPQHKTSAGASWTATSWLQLDLSYQFVGSRPQGGNPLEDYRKTGSASGGATYARMPSYQVVDAKVTVRLNRAGAKAFFAVNNLFDEQYYTNNYYDNVYPAPGRTWRVGVTWAF